MTLALSRRQLFWQPKSVRDPAAAGYAGPGDVVGSALTWGGLRAYNTAYATGSNAAIDVVKTSDGTGGGTINILSTGFLDWATVAALGYPVSVSKVYDQTGNAVHFTQATLAKMPLLDQTNHALDYTSGSNMVLETGSQGTTSQPFTYSAVAQRYANFTTIQAIFDSNANSVELTFRDSANTIGMYAGSDFNTTDASVCADSAWHAMQAVYNGASSVKAIDGTEFTGDPGAATMAGLYYVSSINGTTGQTLSGALVREFGAWASGFDGTQRSNMNSNQHGSSGWNF